MAVSGQPSGRKAAIGRAVFRIEVGLIGAAQVWWLVKTVWDLLPIH